MKLLSFICVLFSIPKAVTGYGFIALGDWGDDNQNQYDTAKAMSEWCQQESCKFIVSTGDNFYPAGVKSPNDPRFETTWKEVYDLPGIKDLTWLISLGNHDYIKGREMNEVEFGTRDKNWYLPYLWYKAPVPDEANLLIVTIDTMAIIKRVHDHKTQLEWLEKTLEESTATWKIVIGHHPPYTVGRHTPGDEAIRKRVVPILQKHQVDVFLLGHDHNLQHINATSTEGGNIDYIVSGAGGKDLYEQDEEGESQVNELGQSLRFFKDVNGFVAFDVDGSHLTVSYVATRPAGKVLYQFERVKKEFKMYDVLNNF